MTQAATHRMQSKFYSEPQSRASSLASLSNFDTGERTIEEADGSGRRDPRAHTIKEERKTGTQRTEQSTQLRDSRATTTFRQRSKQQQARGPVRMKIESSIAETLSTPSLRVDEEGTTPRSARGAYARQEMR